LTLEYAAIPQEMHAVADFFGKKSLRSLTLASVLDNASAIRKAAGDRALLRSIHFFMENRRVDSMLAILEKLAVTHDASLFSDYLDLVNQSGDSSWELLQNISAMGKTREQDIALALALTKDFIASTAGACRVHGGGFAGTMQAYIPLSEVDRYIAKMEAVFGTDAVTVLKIRSIGAAELLF
jgi:galactokinase